MSGSTTRTELPKWAVDAEIAGGQSALVTEGDDETVQERFEAAMRAEEERKAAWELGLPLDPDGELDFEIALTNLDNILSAITTGEKGPALGAAHIPPLLMPHLPDPRASDLFRMWANLNDLEDFTAPESDGNRDVQTAIRRAATEWGLIDHADEATVSAYCDRWIAKCDFVLWRDRMGGQTFESLDAAGWFRWGSA